MLQEELAATPQLTQSHAGISELLGYMRELSDLSALSALAGWDQNTEMPEGGAEVRGEQFATLEGVIHERWTTPRLGKLLDELQAGLQSDFTDADKALVREARRNYDKATKLPKSLVE